MGGLALNGKRIKREWIPDAVEMFMLNHRITGIIAHVCGSYRRGKQDSGDIELVFHARTEDQKCYIKTKIREIFGVTQDYEPKMQGLHGEIQYDLFIADDTSLGAMMLHATGSWKFNKYMRTEAIKRGLKLNQYGLWRISDESPVMQSLCEEDYFKYLGINYVAPEERSI